MTWRGWARFWNWNCRRKGRRMAREVTAAKERIASLAAALRLDRSERRSYLELLLERH